MGYYLYGCVGVGGLAEGVEGGGEFGEGAAPVVGEYGGGTCCALDEGLD